MIRILDENEILPAIDFAWELSKNPETNSYSLYKSKAALEARFLKIKQYPDDKLLGCFTDGRLTGVIYIYVLKSETYLQTKGIYISEGYEESIDELISFLKKDYSGFDIMFGYPKENTAAIEYFDSHSYEKTDSSTDMRLKCEDFVCGTLTPQVEKLTIEDFDSYALFHDTFSMDMYWSSTRIKTCFDEWSIYIYKHCGKIEGSIFVHQSKFDIHEIEIFGLFLSHDFIGKGIEKALLSSMLFNELKNNSILKKVVYFIEDNEENELNAAQEVGFKYFSSYCCYKVKL